jgi:hypothetical protein
MRWKARRVLPARLLLNMKTMKETPFRLPVSQAVYARACATNGWEGYAVKEIPLNKFMENWCVGMHYDGVLTGVEFDSGMFGMETEPLELLADIITELKATEKEVELENYEDLNELEEIVNQFLDDM